MTKEYETLKMLHDKCGDTIYKLEQTILKLQFDIKNHVCDAASSSSSNRSRVDSEEQLEIVKVITVDKTDHMTGYGQFDVVTEKKEVIKRSDRSEKKTPRQ